MRSQPEDPSRIVPPLWRIERAVDLVDEPGRRPIRVRHVVDAGGDGTGTVADLLIRQEGLAQRRQLSALGLGRGAILRRCRTGELKAVHSSVFMVGAGRLDERALSQAALLHAGEDAVLSHGTAAFVWGLRDRPPPIRSLTVVRRHVRDRPSLRVHRVAQLDRRDVRLRGGLPVTAPARTLVDEAADAPDEELEASLAQGRLLQLVDDREIAAAIGRAPLRTGVARVTRLLSLPEGRTTTRSRFERRLLRLLAAARLPSPEVNAPLHGVEVDFLWRERRLIVEADSWTHHGSRQAFEADRARDAIHAARGYRVIRVTYRQLADDPASVIALIARALDLPR